jgi:transcriptional regulator
VRHTVAGESTGERSPLIAGTLEMLILRTLTVGAAHGYAIAQHIERLSDGAFRVEQGSLYPALERVLAKGWATAKWKDSPTGRRARYYTLTASGRRQLAEKVAEYERTTAAIARVLGDVSKA